MDELDRLVNFDEFFMKVENCFYIFGKGNVITGLIEEGEIHLNDEVVLMLDNGNVKAIVTGIEMCRKQLDSAKAGNKVALYFADLKYRDLDCKAVIKDENTKWYNN